MNIFQKIANWFGSLFSSKPVEPSELPTVLDIPSQPIVFTNPSSKDARNKIAVCTGLNKYPDPRNNLAGCVNDSFGFANILRNVYGFNKIIILQNEIATIEKLTSIIRDCFKENPDVFAYTNSSHGTLVPHSDGSVHEAICLYNGFLLNENLRALLDEADDRCFITVISDSCHSQGVLDKDFVKAPEKAISSVMGARFMPFPDFSKIKVDVPMSGARKAFFEPIDMVEILISGCKSNEYSYDANFNGIANGALSYYLLNILKETPNISYNDLIVKLNAFLPSSKYPQNPVLQCADVNKSRLIFS